MPSDRAQSVNHKHMPNNEAEFTHVAIESVASGSLEVRSFGYERGLIAARRFDEGATIHEFSAASDVSAPTRHSVQVSESRHILLAPAFLETINHGCNPNVAFDVQSWRLLALRPISEGDELLYFYPSTEWLLTCPFRCRCLSTDCIDEVRGAAFLTKPIAPAIPICTHIRSLLARHTPSKSRCRVTVERRR